MTENNRTAKDYRLEDVEVVKTVCLTIATVLGDEMMEKHVVLVGGLVPTLLCPTESLPEQVDQHVGTTDADFCFSLAIMDEELYKEITETLRDAGFEPDTNDKGNPTPHRWKHHKLPRVVVDFLMPEVEGESGLSKWLESGFAPIMGKAVHLVFDPPPTTIELSGKTLEEAEVTRKLRVCTPGAYVVLKCIAHRGRTKSKDAYDLWYMTSNFKQGPASVAKTLKPLLDDGVAQEAVQILKEDFSAIDQLGPVRVGTFLDRAGEEVLLQQVVGAFDALLQELED